MKIPLLITALIATLSVAGPALAKKDEHKPLPPGLQKKAEHGQKLPPGWQKKLARGETLEQGLYEQADVIERDSGHGTLTLRLEGKLIKVLQNSHEIIEILDGR